MDKFGSLNYCHIPGGNFGDDLNLELWSNIFPNIYREDNRFEIYGIGTLLGAKHNQKKKIVLGSGLDAASSASRAKNFEYYWVRGKLTAKALGISEDLALGDAAILWPNLFEVEPKSNGRIGLIPHWKTWDSYDWEKVASSVGLQAISPKQHPEAVLDQILKCSKIISESLHGAIFADAIGVPWSACVLAHRFNKYKWEDWLTTIERPFTGFVADRPLVNNIPIGKSIANRIGHWLGYSHKTSFSHLRPVRAATMKDEKHIANSLLKHAKDESNFNCSNKETITLQRKKMLVACAHFAQNYQLEFKEQ